MHIRPASVDDIAGMHRVRTRVRENRLGDPAWIQPHDYAAMLTERGRGWVAEADGQVVGFAVADASRMNVCALFVDPSVEGRGVGRRLHDAMMEWFFTSAGAERVWLSTGPGTRAERFYQAAGWRHAGLEPGGEARYEMSRDPFRGSPADAEQPGADSRSGASSVDAEGVQRRSSKRAFGETRTDRASLRPPSRAPDSCGR